jgi:hypothetical protein
MNNHSTTWFNKELPWFTPSWLTSTKIGFFIIVKVFWCALRYNRCSIQLPLFTFMDSLHRISYNHNNYTQLLFLLYCSSLKFSATGLWISLSYELYFSFYLIFFPANNELVPTHAQMVKTHSELDTAHSWLVFHDFMGPCSFMSPIFFSFFSLPSWSSVSYWSYAFSLCSTSSRCSLSNLPTQHAPNTHLWLILSHLSLLCHILPCLNEFLEALFCCFYYCCEFGLRVHNLFHCLQCQTI